MLGHVRGVSHEHNMGRGRNESRCPSNEKYYETHQPTRSCLLDERRGWEGVVVNAMPSLPPLFRHTITLPALMLRLHTVYTLPSGEGGWLDGLFPGLSTLSGSF